MNVLRYDDNYVIVTDLDPIEDILNFITTLKSKGFTNDLLRNTHGFNNLAEINRTSKLVALHVDNAISLANQGFDGPPETSFLPLYYSTLNLAKVNLLLLNKRIDLERNRWHGARYIDSDMSKHFLNENIRISNRGTIPLLYTTLTGKIIGRQGLDVKLEELYSRITSIGAEYTTITKNEGKLLGHIATIEQDDVNGHYLKIEIFDDKYKSSPPLPRTLKAYKGLKMITDNNGQSHYESKRYHGQFVRVKKKLLKQIQRQLISDYYFEGLGEGWINYTPISGCYHVFNEELSIMLAYFHLSNVVRYNPEHLHKLMDSRYWALILGLRKHGYFRFLKLMWGNYIKKSFDIS